ncbi:amino acid/polyamine transporter I [Aspergillus ambiguus]|uniref:amino acid/polyamine transporter I n=1 Tax=Aspergillus ambiguus TaxID=176160 RepID=UPI003CCDFE60
MAHFHSSSSTNDGPMTNMPSPNNDTSRMGGDEHGPLLQQHHLAEVEFSTEDGDRRQHPNRDLGLLSTIFLITNRMIGTAIFATPSSIAASVGSPGAVLALWLVGLILSYCGMFIWIELACLMPRSGGEKVYLAAAYPRPRKLITVVFAVHVILLGFTGIGSVVIAENLLLLVQNSVNDGVKRCLAMAVLAGIATIHIYSRSWGVRVMNSLASAKILVLSLIILSGVRALRGDLSQIPDPGNSFQHPFAGSPTTISSYTTALFKILSTYQGWNNAAYVLDEVKDPRRTIKVAGIVGLGMVGLLYMLTNVAYFIVATPEELSQTGVTVVALLIGKVFGETMMWFSAILTALSSFGNLLTATFTMSRVVQQFAQEGILPGREFFASTAKSGSPTWAFLLLFFSSILFIVFVPFGEVYSLQIDVGQYSMAFINLLVVVGLFIIRKHTAQQTTFRAWDTAVYLFFGVQVFLLVTPFTPVTHERPKAHSVPEWLPPILVILVFLGAGIYWYMSWVLLPRRHRLLQ